MEELLRDILRWLHLDNLEINSDEVSSYVDLIEEDLEGIRWNLPYVFDLNKNIKIWKEDLIELELRRYLNSNWVIIRFTVDFNKSKATVTIKGYEAVRPDGVQILSNSEVSKILMEV